ncbi:hypothetical protein Nepgr_025134 [Nepenthes gracilis]|uniref:Uncharacterized protein n=1 Tax=Nepenthes gracilis TaxID=150966 RepID=A0AAD3T637_NEPGR|nr:hypothetical protein Nepgr_025134 [Nepenthes gracilis]
MNVLDSPPDALLFDSAALGFVFNNLWTWVAVLAAASISYWRLKGGAASVSSQIKSDPLPHDTVSEVKSQITAPLFRQPTSNPGGADASALGTSEASVSNVCDGDLAPTKGKFAVYYEAAEEMESVDEDGDAEERPGWEEGGGLPIVRRWWRWDDDKELDAAATRLRMGDLGWHRYQDLTVLNGSVVRLWEGRNLRRCYPC